MPHVIRDRDGKPIKRSRNLRGIREFARTNTVKILAIDQVAHGGGKLMMLFEDGASYETNFASFNVLRWFVRTWRKVYGTSLMINGTDAGLVGRDNP